MIVSVSEIFRKFSSANNFNLSEQVSFSDDKGGNLTTFLHTMPILKQHNASHVTSMCLGNALAFLNMDYFLSEYQLITSREMLYQLTSV